MKTHPDVFDAIVVGIPDDRFGERVAAVVIQPRPDHEAPTLEELQEHCRDPYRRLQDPPSAGCP